MAVPPFHEFIEPLLRYLARHPEGVPKRVVCSDLADAMHLTEADREERIPSGGQLVYENRIGWAHDRLKRAGYSSAPRRGFWQILPDGMQLLAQCPTSLPPQVVAEIATMNQQVRLNGFAPVAPEDREFASQSPMERMEQALHELQDSASRELLELIGLGTPLFFESLVLDLLHAMGYGTSRSDLQRVGGKGDGGIDGIISLDRLGLEKVYVQAKRWQGGVGAGEIRGFVGALQLQGATKGVFMTTGGFTKDALDTADRARGSVVLVDGQRLSALMIEHGIGVTYKEFKVPKVDGDYFEGV